MEVFSFSGSAKYTAKFYVVNYLNSISEMEASKFQLLGVCAIKIASQVILNLK